MNRAAYMTVLWACLALAGCSGQLGAESDTQPANAARAPYTSPGKPAAPVKLAFELRGTPQIGIPLEVVLELSFFGGTPGNLAWALASEGAVRVAGVDRNLEKTSIAPWDRLRRVVTIVPESPGRHYLHLTVTTDSTGVPMSRVFSVPVQVGPQAPRRGGIEHDADGIAIKTLKSLEKTES